MSDASTVPDEFTCLPKSLQSKIDKAFDRVIHETSIENREDRTDAPGRTGSVSETLPDGFVLEQEQPGGFIIEQEEPGGFVLDEDQDVEQPGVFIPDDAPSTSHAGSLAPETSLRAERIPLAQVPIALSYLSLPADSQVLSVFRNAASGWSESSRVAGDEGRDTVKTRSREADAWVNRNDWRAVCAVLLGADEGDEDEGDEDEGDEDEERDEEQFEDQDTESEVTPDSDDSYSPTESSRAKRAQPSATSSSARKSKRLKVASASPSLLPSELPRLSAAQKQSCLHMFNLFLRPSDSDDDVEVELKLLGIREVSNVASLLKEKIPTEEIILMLKTYSTHPSRTLLSYDDFEKMMIDTGFV